MRHANETTQHSHALESGEAHAACGVSEEPRLILAKCTSIHAAPEERCAYSISTRGPGRKRIRVFWKHMPVAPVAAPRKTAILHEEVRIHARQNALYAVRIRRWCSGVSKLWAWSRATSRTALMNNTLPRRFGCLPGLSLPIAGLTSDGTSHGTGFLKPFRLLTDRLLAESRLDVIDDVDDLVQGRHPMFSVHVDDGTQQFQVDGRP